MGRIRYIELNELHRSGLIGEFYDWSTGQTM